MAGARTPGPWGSGHETVSKLPSLPSRVAIAHAGPAGMSLAVQTGAAPVGTPAVRYRSRFVYRGVQYRLTTSERASRSSAGEEPIPVVEALEILPRMLEDGIAVGLGAWEGQELLERMRRGSVVLLRARARAHRVPAQSPASAAPSSRRPVKDGWIEIQVKDEHGRARGGDAYRLELPDGRVFTGTVGASGVISFHGIDPGMAKFSLTKLDAARWS